MERTGEQRNKAIIYKFPQNSVRGGGSNLGVGWGYSGVIEAT
jgi:hypothetical protein